MDKSIKIGITRNRLFDFQNVVTFSGEYIEEFDEKEMSKAVKMLSIKEPLITSLIELDENSDAYLQCDRAEAKVEFLNADLNLFLQKQKVDGINFNQCLFKFFVINKNVLVIFAHTVVSDSKSLLILAEELLSYYNKESVSVEPKPIKLFSNDNELPNEVDSFVADRVTEVLNNDWLMKPRRFTANDYNNARFKYNEKTGELKSQEYCIDKELSETLSLRCEELKIDFSSCILFALMKIIAGERKFSKIVHKANVQLDRRPYFVDFNLYSVGAFNGTVSLELPKTKKNLTEQVKEFHENYYKKFSLCFNAFYNEMFLSRLDPAFLDSCFMYKAGVYKSRISKKLATLYGCEQQFLLGFSSVNLRQTSWKKLSTFHHIQVKEPHKFNENVSISLVLGDENRLLVEYNSTDFTDLKIEEIFKKIPSILKQI